MVASLLYSLLFFGDQFKVFFIEFVAVLLLFYVLVLGHKACGILTLGPGIKLTLIPALECEVLTTEPPEKSPLLYSWGEKRMEAQIQQSLRGKSMDFDTQRGKG